MLCSPTLATEKSRKEGARKFVGLAVRLVLAVTRRKLKSAIFFVVSLTLEFPLMLPDARLLPLRQAKSRAR